MLTIPYKIAMILIICICLVACHTSKNVTTTTTEETEQSMLKHIQGTKLTSTLEVLGDINIADSFPRFIPRQYTPAKLTMQQEHFNLADTTNKHESSFSNKKSVSAKNVDMFPISESNRITLSLITVSIFTVIVLGYCIRLFQQ